MGWWRRKKDKEKQRLAQKNGEVLLEKLIEYCDGKSNPIKHFSASQIRTATGSFSKNNSLDRKSGSNYRCYRGMLEGRLVLVKKWVAEPRRYIPCREKICSDIAISSMVSGQKNFLKLLGCSLEFRNPVLVYEYAVCRANPENLLDVSLPWNMKLKIAKEIAEALTYLHTAFSKRIIYKDMVPRKIFLDEKGAAKLSEFDNSVLIPEGEKFVVRKHVEGTFGYLDPDYIRIGRVTENTDVYGFGALMLTILTALQPSHLHLQYEDSLIELVADGRFVEIVDPKVLESCKEEKKWQLETFFMLSLRCIGCVGDVPSMIEVAKQLKRMLV